MMWRVSAVAGLHQGLKTVLMTPLRRYNGLRNPHGCGRSNCSNPWVPNPSCQERVRGEARTRTSPSSLGSTGSRIYAEPN